MKINTYTYPKSSFLSMEKDMDIIVNMILKNERLKKLLYYTTKDCLDKPNLTEEESLDLIGKNIKIVPKIEITNDLISYIMIRFNDFLETEDNPEFRQNIIEFDIICNIDLWQLKDFQLRPYKIAAELDTMFSNQHLSGIGNIEFVGAKMVMMNAYQSCLCVVYQTVHGEEDKKNPLSVVDKKQINNNFDAIFNED